MADTATAPCNLDEQWLGFWGIPPTGVACGEPSNATVTLACVHEHVDAERICAGCAADMQQAAGEMTCKRCWEAPGNRHALLPARRDQLGQRREDDRSGARQWLRPSR
jgi:hypothetical protein